jgi:hypothetical protein
MGSRLRPDEILTLLGVGGMSVAIMVLPENFSTDPIGEARALAALNHPHTGNLYAC